jgi:hypothetical protein
MIWCVYGTLYVRLLPRGTHFVFVANFFLRNIALTDISDSSLFS